MPDPPIGKTSFSLFYRAFGAPLFPLTRQEILGISQTVISLRKLRFSKAVHA